MFLAFPDRGERPSSSPSLGGILLRSGRLATLPILLLGLGFACSHHSSSSTTAPGTPPSITTAPTDASTVSGRPVSLTVIATGAATLRYQWSKDGQPVLGAIGATYTLNNPRPADSGRYTVTVTNSVGNTTSTAATLTVLQSVEFKAAMGLAVDAAGTLYVADASDHTIWKVTPSNQKTLFAGGSGLPGTADGVGTAARFAFPGGLALDPAGNLLVADTGNHTIRRIAKDGTVSTVAGAPGLPGTADGTGSAARFNAPFGLAVDGAGTVYIADSQNHTIRRMSAAGVVTTFAGLAGAPGMADGTGTTALFNEPNGLALSSSGTLYVADYGNSRIRTVSSTAQVATLAGQLNNPGFADNATGTSAQFRLPVALAMGTTGTLWVADTFNHALRAVSTTGAVSTFAGTGGTAGNADGLGTAALFNQPCAVAVAPSGNLILADTANHLLRTITPSGTVTTLTFP